MTTPIAYNEYKFFVSNEKLGYIRELLDAFLGGSDPFSVGYVDSIYYDSIDQKSYTQCLEGEQLKLKFRIRGYGDGTFRQLHLKEKNMFGVAKVKSPIKQISEDSMHDLEWDALQPIEGEAPPNFMHIKGQASRFGYLQPAIRVRYLRYRYRMNDYRITLDTNVEVQGFSNGFDQQSDYGILPHHVLELKSITARPHLPFLGLTRLPQISFSKFYLGMNMLASGGID